MRETDTSIVLSIPGQTDLVIPMENVYRAEARIRDLAFVNRDTAGELLAEFNEAYSILSRQYGKVHYLTSSLDRLRRKRKAVLTLDVIPEKLKEKGLATSRSPIGSEDVREAFYASDEEYDRLSDGLGQAEAVKEMLGLKLRSFYNAIDSIKTVVRSDRTLPTMNHQEAQHSLSAPMAPLETTVNIPVSPEAKAALLEHKPLFTKPVQVVFEDPAPIKSTNSRWAKPKHEGDR